MPIVKIIAIVLLALLLVGFLSRTLYLWIQGFVNGARIPFIRLLTMRWRGIFGGKRATNSRRHETRKKGKPPDLR